MTDGLVGKFGYFGIVLLLVLGGLGVPIPEEAPIILSAVLSHKGAMFWPMALGACFLGVLLGDFVVYFLGYFYGEKVLSIPVTRKFLTREREEQIKGYFHRHGVKILIVGRFAVGFRTAAYLTAGILRLPPLRLLVADLFAATLSTLLMFGLGYWFADRIERGLEEFKHYLMVIVAAVVAGWLLYRYYRARQRAGQPVGPPVLVSPEDAPLPPDDLAAEARQKTSKTPSLSPEAPEPAPPPSPAPEPVARPEPPPLPDVSEPTPPGPVLDPAQADPQPAADTPARHR